MSLRSVHSTVDNMKIKLILLYPLSILTSSTWYRKILHSSGMFQQEETITLSSIVECATFCSVFLPECNSFEYERGKCAGGRVEVLGTDEPVQNLWVSQKVDNIIPANTGSTSTQSESTTSSVGTKSTKCCCCCCRVCKRNNLYLRQRKD